MRVRIAFWIMNAGIKLLPTEFRHDRFIGNCIKTGHLKVNRMTASTEKRNPDELRGELMRTIDQSPLDMNGYASMINVENAADAIIAAGWRKEAE